MANRYWVGGTATWDATAGSKWATTSGGAGGSAVPTAADDVFFDASSGAVTVTTSGTATDLCRSLNFTGFTGTFSHAASTTVSVGDATSGASNIALKLVAGMTYTRGSTTTSVFSLLSTSSTTQTIETAGKGLGAVTINGSGCTFQLVDNLTASGTVTLTAGTFDANNFNLSIGSFLASNSNTRAILMGSGTWTLNSTSTVWSTATSTNLTLTPGTSVIVVANTSSTSKTINTGTVTLNDITISGDNIGWQGNTTLRNRH